MLRDQQAQPEGVLSLAGLQWFTSFCLRSACRFLTALCGLFLMTLGFLFCLTLVGALIGVPMLTVGFLMIVRRLI